VGGVARSDVPRNSQRTALLGDPRNDENLVVSQLQRALLGFHNRVLDDVRDDLGPTVTAQELFAEAQRTVRWHYQWLVIHEFLVTTVGADVVDDVLAHGPAHFRWRNHPYTPVAFSVAANRFGHSQVRPSYRANFGTSASDPQQQFFALIFDPSATDPDDPADLRGGHRDQRRFIDWQTFFRLRRRPRAAHRADPRRSPAYLRQDPDWTPSYGTGDDFSIADLLRAAGVVAALP
jgi:Animal haem peroxidase